MNGHEMEIEAKFALPNAKTLQRLRIIKELAGFSLSASRVVQVHDTFLDTAGRLILAAGYVCRRRERDRAITITLKQLSRATDAVHRREELEIALPADLPPAQWHASPARDRVLKLIGDEPLAALFDLKQRRILRAVTRDAQPVAELSLDAVHVSVQKLTLAWLELEIELTPPGTEDDLAALVTCLQDEWKLQPEPRSKFERALEFVTANAAVAPVRPRRRAQVSRKSARPKKLKKPGIEINDAMSDAARKTLLFHFQRMAEHEAGTRAGQDIEELHTMRVATRRMRAALHVFDGYLDADAIKPFAKLLRRTGRTLGAVRDLDVFRFKAQHYLDQLAAERQTELEPLLAAWQTEHAAAREELLAYLDSEPYQRFKEQFGEFLQTPGAGAPVFSREETPAPYRVQHVLPAILFEGWASVRAYDEWMTGADAPLARYHQLRIASKGLRYTLEFFEEVLGADAGGLIEKMKGLQDYLGNLQDSVVTCNVLRDFLTWGTWQRGDRKIATPREFIVAPGVAAYLAARQSEIQELVKAFPSVWSEISGPEFHRRLAAVAAAL